MAFGDVGGNGTELIVTCRTPEDGRAVIRKGDAVVLTGNYEVRTAGEFQTVFGQAMADASGSCEAVPVRVRGICAFRYADSTPLVDGSAHGVVTASVPGAVRKPVGDYGYGINVKVDTKKSEVHVLL